MPAMNPNNVDEVDVGLPIMYSKLTRGTAEGVKVEVRQGFVKITLMEKVEYLPSERVPLMAI